MGFLRKIRAAFHNDWCGKCQSQMVETGRQLYMLPISVDHYEPHQDAGFFIKNMRKVSCKAEIPAGFYACGAISYRCPECGHRMVKLSVFLPVRDQELPEDTVCFENGEMDAFLWQ